MGMPISSGGGFSTAMSMPMAAPAAPKAPPPPPAAPAPDASALQMLATQGNVGTRINTTA